MLSKFTGEANMPIAENWVRGPADSPLIEQTIDAVLDHVTDRLAEHDALVLRHHGVRWTHGEL
jgi:hypothetical protein